MIERHDDLGHMGNQRTLKRMQMQFYWPRMIMHINNWYKQCDVCQRLQNPKQQPNTPSNPIKATRAGEIVHADLLESTRSESTNKYVLELVDGFTKLANMNPVDNKLAETTECYFLFVHAREWCYRTLTNRSGGEQQQ